MSLFFFVNCILLGIGLSMDAFSLSMASGLAEPAMPRRRMITIAAVFGSFQLLMPLIGWGCVFFILDLYASLRPYIPWAAFCILSALGLLMIRDSLTGNGESAFLRKGFTGLLVMGIATSIDALSAGFAIAGYDAAHALAASVIIGAVTFCICLLGLWAGKHCGMRFTGRAVIFGGLILIAVGLEAVLIG